MSALIFSLFVGLSQVVTQPVPVETAQFSEPFVGLEFSYPKTWKIARHTRETTKFEIPIEGSLDKADLEIIRTAFHSTKEIWQTIQLQVNQTQRREVVRQWEQAVIRVPMLNTQINYMDKGVQKTTLTGLYYTRTPSKFFFRLTAAVGDYDKVKYDFDKALESLKTIDGSLPQEDDPALPLEVQKKPEPAPPKPINIGTPTLVKSATVRNMSVIPAFVSTKHVAVGLPEGWTTGEKDVDTFNLKNPKVSEVVTMEVFYELDSDRPTSALIKKSAKELAEYVSVANREDTEGVTNLSGASICTVWRIGKSADGPLVTFHGTAEQGDFYVLFSYWSKSPDNAKRDRKVIEQLLSLVKLAQANP